jgi:glycosyltransferase involved in cell wall biosynthesis
MEKYNKMISIIIPTLNEETVIEKTLKLLRRFHGDYEIIVSDGMSTDRTVEIAKKYADKVVISRDLPKQNISIGKNYGAKEAKGDYLLFLDADVEIPNPDTFFNKILSDFIKDKNLVGVTVFLKVFPEMETIADKIFYSMNNYIVFINNNIFHNGAASGEFQMVRHEIFNKTTGYNENFAAGEDFEFFHRLSLLGKTKSIPSLFAYHTGRRPHKVGWSKLLYTWFMNWFHTTFLNKPWSDIWEEVR